MTSTISSEPAQDTTDDANGDNHNHHTASQAVPPYSMQSLVTAILDSRGSTGAAKLHRLAEVAQAIIDGGAALSRPSNPAKRPDVPLDDGTTMSSTHPPRLPQMSMPLITIITTSISHHLTSDASLRTW